MIKYNLEQGARMMMKIIGVMLFLFFHTPFVFASYTPLNNPVVTNIGIGTSTPQTSLAVAQGNVGIGTWTAEGGPLIIHGTGNVGIGSVWPGTKLDVNGTVRASSFSGDGSLLTNISAGGWVDNGSVVHLSTASDNVGIGTSDASQGRLIVADGNVGIGTKTPQGAFVVTNGNVGIGTWSPGTARLLVGGGGNVGIGTFAPGVGFEVGSGGARFTGLSPSLIAMQIYQTGGTNLQLRSTGTNGGSWYIGSSDSSNAIGGGNKLYFSTDSDTSNSGVVFDSNYNVGLGTSVPLSKLTVVGNIGIGTGKSSTYTYTSAPSGGLMVEGNVGIGTFDPQAKLAVVSGGVGIGTLSAAGGALITRGIGNVGVGTAWPGEALDVNGTVRATAFSGSGAAVTNLSVGGWTDGGTNVYPTSTSDNIGIGTSDASAGKLVILSGNVGIGTKTPQGGFVVTNGNVGLGTWVPSQLFQINKPAGSPIVFTSGGNLGVGTTTPQAAFVVTSGNVGLGTWDTSGGKLILMGNGNIGLGTAFPGAGLDINSTVATSSGDVIISRITANQTGSTTGTILGNQTQAKASHGAGTVSNIVPYYSLLFNSGNAAVTNMWGNASLPINISTGTVTNATGYYSNVQKTNTGAITSAINFYGKIDNGNATNAITNGFGLYLDSATVTGPITNYYGIYQADTTARNYFGGVVGIGSTAPQYRLEIVAPDNGIAQRNIINATSANVTAADTFISFNSTSGQIGSIAGTAGSGVIAYNTFTGSHWTQIEDRKHIFDLALLCSTGETVDWEQKQLTKTRMCNSVADPTALGVFGGFDNEGRAMALSIGTGYILITNKGDDIHVGDFLVSSDVAGYAQKQTSTDYMNYTVAKAMQDVLWQPGEKTRKIAVIYLGG